MEHYDSLFIYGGKSIKGKLDATVHRYYFTVHWWYDYGTIKYTYVDGVIMIMFRPMCLNQVHVPVQYGTCTVDYLIVK